MKLTTPLTDHEATVIAATLGAAGKPLTCAVHPSGGILAMAGDARRVFRTEAELHEVGRG